ncbi:DivIVA domain-containing protein [uncultured Cytophaga sp.]|uniref:DivIVA domain-containing protein n=1 Tax=uncultured Cytophaga sp. TaxID=160238 RepID=UPI00261827B8|nr:DivIVA domain-containing protein [uncultured Cytophaga sp.]
MKVTPIEIRQKDFNKAFRGYDKEEVDAFLKSLSQEWEKLMDENRDVKNRLELADREVGRLREVESSLFKTIKNAEDTGANLIEHAQRQSDLHMREAQMNAEAIMSEARNRARKTVEEGEYEARTLVAKLIDEVTTLQKEHAEIEFKKQHAIQEIQALGEGLLDRVQREKAKPNRVDTEQRIEKVIEAAKQIKTEVADDFSGHELKTIIKPITPVVDKTIVRDMDAPLFNIDTIPPAFEPAKKVEQVVDMRVEKTAEELNVDEPEIKKTPIPKVDKPTEGTGSFFDSI